MRKLLVLLLVSLTVSGCLSASDRTSEHKKFDITLSSAESNVLQITYSTSSYRATPDGFYEKGVLRITNAGNITLYNLTLKLQGKTALSPSELDVIAHATMDSRSEPKVIQNIIVSPSEVFIERLEPERSRNLSTEIIGWGEGNFYSINVVYNNKILFGVAGFVPDTHISTSKDFTAEELANMPPEMLAEIIPKDVLERFTPEELAGFTADELAHIVPSKFPEPKNQSQFLPQEPKKVPIRPDEVDR